MKTKTRDENSPVAAKQKEENFSRICGFSGRYTRFHTQAAATNTRNGFRSQNSTTQTQGKMGMKLTNENQKFAP
jgi:hypothetical protein